MNTWLQRVPTQRFDAELMDAPVDDQALLAHTFRNMATTNRYLGGNRAVMRWVARWIDHLPPTHTPTILDVATGGAYLPQALVQWAARRGRPIHMLASDRDPDTIAIAGQTVRALPVVLLQHDALALPFVDQSIDVVTCMLALHHLHRTQAVQALREMARVARCGVIVNDLRRSWGGYLGARFLALTAFDELSQNDGPLSVLRAYTRAEAQALLDAAGTGGTAHAEPVFRLSIVIDK